MTKTHTVKESRADPRMARPEPTLLLHMATTPRIMATEKNISPMSVQHVRKPWAMQIQPALIAEVLDLIGAGRGGGTEAAGKEFIYGNYTRLMPLAQTKALLDLSSFHRELRGAAVQWTANASIASISPVAGAECNAAVILNRCCTACTSVDVVFIPFQASLRQAAPIVLARQEGRCLIK